jgi:hypothetical protein
VLAMSDDKALVERLRNGVGYWMREKEIDGAPFEAADRIEAQAAEIARLKDVLHRIAWDVTLIHHIDFSTVARAALGG